VKGFFVRYSNRNHPFGFDLFYDLSIPSTNVMKVPCFMRMIIHFDLFTLTNRERPEYFQLTDVIRLMPMESAEMCFTRLFSPVIGKVF